MAESTTLARPYAKAAFQTARQDSALEEWSAMLGLSAAVAGQATVSSVLSDPSLSNEQIAKALIPNSSISTISNPYSKFYSYILRINTNNSTI